MRIRKNGPIKVQGIKKREIPMAIGIISGANSSLVPRVRKIIIATPIALEIKVEISIAFLARK
jgi:hypothetical protein